MRNFFRSCCIKVILFFLTIPLIVYANNSAVLLQVNHAIGPATQSYIEHNLIFAKENNASLVIIQIDTPGGLESSMHGITKAILASPVPVVSYVYPTGGRAASAGTFILYASSIAAMAPGTNIGAASPVSIGSMEPTTEKKPDTNLSTLERKKMNDAVANIQSLADIHKRNSEWGIKAVREAASLSATDALKLKVVDVVAKDIPDLIKQINGRQVIANGVSKTIQTDNFTIVEKNPDWRFQFLSIITDPNVAYILLLIGIYGLFFEFYNPGAILPGVAGTIALLVALYAYQLLPVNYAGFALLLLGIAFIVVEILISSFGILGLGGIIAFVTGSILLLDVQGPGYQIAWSLVIMMTVFTVGFLILTLGASIHSLQKNVVTGSEALIGSEGIVVEQFKEDQWQIRLHGELWLATSSSPLSIGQKVRVLKLTGLVLIVEPSENTHDQTLSKITDKGRI